MAQTRIVADLHLHSRFARATSRNLNLAALASSARGKGITLLAAPDFTHPAWLEEMRGELVEDGDGIYAAHGARFMLATEVACNWQQGGRGRRVHILVLAPGFAAVDRFNKALDRVANREEDGRPALGISGHDLALMAWEADPRCVIIPAHVWTPWFGLYGSKSGFDSLEECFGDVSDRIKAVETGLSSDPPMNWRVPDVDRMSIVSFSDAHSAPKMGRELTVLDAEFSYSSVASALEGNGVLETIEFHPEHGKYHFDGHRKCDVRMTPAESAAVKYRCPVCGRKLTLGVLHRVEELAGRPPLQSKSRGSLVSGPADRPPFRSLVPLQELLSQALGVGTGAKRVTRAYHSLVEELGGELDVLISSEISDIERITDSTVAAAVSAVREGHVETEPGYDGVYGSVKAII
ncbi:MAG: endonuclease Q family protein [Dehalococcoidia bacterium]